MSNFGQMQSDLQLLVQANLINTDLGGLLNLCQRQEVENYDWSFLHDVVNIWAFNQNNAGTISISNNSTIVTGVGTNFTSSNPNMAGWVMQVGPTLAVPVVIGSVQSATQLTLAQPYGGATQTGIPMRAYQLYYDVFPLIEVMRVRQIFYLEEVSRQVLDFMDPARIAVSGNPAVYWAKGLWNPTLPTGTVLSSVYPHWSIELWPTSTTPLPYLVEGKVGPIDMVATTDNPQIPSAVLENKAAMYACRSIFASSGNPKWLQLAESYQKQYEFELEQVKLADHERLVIKKLSEVNQSTPGLDVYANHDLFAPKGF